MERGWSKRIEEVSKSQVGWGCPEIKVNNREELGVAEELRCSL